MRLFELYETFTTRDVRNRLISTDNSEGRWGTDWVSDFTVGPHKYRFKCRKINRQSDLIFNSDDNPLFTNLWGAISGDAKIIDLGFVLIKDNGLEIDRVLNTGGAFEVFSNVISLIKELLKLYDADVILFRADEPSRRKLYHKIINRLKSDYNYDIYMEDGDFLLVKPHILSAGRQ